MLVRTHFINEGFFVIHLLLNIKCVFDVKNDDVTEFSVMSAVRTFILRNNFYKSKCLTVVEGYSFSPINKIIR